MGICPCALKAKDILSKPLANRSVTLTTRIGKLFENIIAKKFSDYLDKHNLINGSQTWVYEGKLGLINRSSFCKKSLRSC